MSKINDGGPAFPSVLFRQEPTENWYSDGMSFRDRVAIEALGGMLAHSTRYKPREIDSDLYWHQAIAKEAYELADAMIATRSETKE